MFYDEELEALQMAHGPEAQGGNRRALSPPWQKKQMCNT